MNKSTPLFFLLSFMHHLIGMEWPAHKKNVYMPLTVEIATRDSLPRVASQIDVDLSPGKEPALVLQHAAKYGKLTLLRKYLGKYPTIPIPGFLSLLSIAARSGQVPIVQELLLHGATDDDIMASLSWAIEYRRSAVIREFLAKDRLTQPIFSEICKQAKACLTQIAESHEKSGYDSDPGTPYGFWSPRSY